MVVHCWSATVFAVILSWSDLTKIGFVELQDVSMTTGATYLCFEDILRH
jgi:hypothetical protein